MTDVGSHHFVKGAKGHQVLVPQPSDDEHDPLVSLVHPRRLMDIGIDISVELEFSLEGLNYLHSYCGDVCPRTGPFGTCANVRRLYQRL